jgi:cystathionine gamma-synthase
MNFETLLIHGGSEIDESTGAVTPPIHLSTTFARDDVGKPLAGYSYIRDANPTGERCEKLLAAMEGGVEALTFASGLAATAAFFQALPERTHVILPEDCYFGVLVMVRDFFSRWGLEWSAVDMRDLDAVRSAVRPNTKWIWAESPSNPLIGIADLPALREIAESAGAELAVDNTFATPALQRPIAIGASVVMHSTTKYIGGHSDVQGGALIFTDGELAQKVAGVRAHTGGVASPFNSWLIMRGARSLAARMRVHCDNAMKLATALSSNPAVEVVHYPGLSSDPGHEIAKRQMLGGFGGMLSFRIHGTGSDALAVNARTRIFTRATSLGGVESLIEHRRTSEGEHSKTPENLIRVSVGLEHPDDLIADLEQALAGR